MTRGCFGVCTHVPWREAGMRLVWANQGTPNRAASSVNLEHPYAYNLATEYNYFPFPVGIFDGRATFHTRLFLKAITFCEVTSTPPSNA